jgi:hypothetical protein
MSPSCRFTTGRHAAPQVAHLSSTQRKLSLFTLPRLSEVYSHTCLVSRILGLHAHAYLDWLWRTDTVTFGVLHTTHYAPTPGVVATLRPGASASS